MVCAEDEIGLGDSHEGIMVLKKMLNLAHQLVKYLIYSQIKF